MMRLALILPLLACRAAAAAEDSFYQGPALFSTRPSETASLQTIDRFGPVGMGIELHQPAFVMKIKNIEEGSPAAATGKLRPGQIIETINGQELAELDPRIRLGRIITQAEATDGVIRLMVKDTPGAKPEPVIVRIPVLGAYSETWPLKCPKSDRIVRNFADHLAAMPWRGNVGRDGLKMLFLLSTGEQKDLEVVRGWVEKTVAVHKDRSVTRYAWYIGYGGVPLAEYYLRTGDKSVLPVLKKLADTAKETQYLDGWAGRGGCPFLYNGGGHLNAAGTNVLTFLLLAKECGVEVDEHTLQSALAHFYRFAGRGINPYGDHRPETGFVDNGKCGNLAFAMAAAASLTPGGESWLYARARDVSAVKGFYSTSWMLHGHTGGGIGEIWRSASMGLMYDKNQKKYREFLDNRMWFYELSRRYDGSFGILGGAGYDKPDPWGVGLALTYSVPRRTLRITGAPRTKYCRPYGLPKRPWGTPADDAFLSLEPAADTNGRSPALEQETLANDSGAPLLQRIGAPDGTEETVRRYAHHQDHGIRKAAALRAAGKQMNRLGWLASVEIPPWGVDLLAELLESNDPRVRRAAATGVGYLPPERITKEMFDLLIKMIGDPQESWWVKDAALQAVGRVPPEWIVPHVDTLVSCLRHDEWWLRNAALVALTPVVANDRCYKRILPALGELIATNQRANVLGPVRGIVARLNDAGPEVQQAARETLGQACAGYPEVTRAPGGQDVTAAFDANLEIIARTLSEVPGGFDTLFEVAGKRFPEETLPHNNLYLANSDPARFGPELSEALAPIIREKMISEYVGRYRIRLLSEANGEVQSAYPIATLDALADLYRKVGIHEYDWQRFGPDLRNAEWWYHSFYPSPQEQVPWDQLISRFRPVTFPKGMENWCAVDFDAARAGWLPGSPGTPRRSPSSPAGSPMICW